jgi:very-short-patch-repair endonuclease
LPVGPHTRRMSLERHFARRPTLTTQELLRRGATRSQLAWAVANDRLIRIRRGHYALPGTDDAILKAVRIGGRLGCVTAASRFGVWVIDDFRVHVAMRHPSSRLRSPDDRNEKLNPENRGGCELHWWVPIQRSRDSAHSVGLVEALVQIVRCQPMVFAVASLDSALNQRLIQSRDLDTIFSALPMHLRAIRSRLDGRCMSGLESIVRLMAEDLGFAVRAQVAFPGVGIVDLLVEGCVIIETDGRANHDSVIHQRRDYGRDAQLTSDHFTVLRFSYQQVVFEIDTVRKSLLGALRAHRAARHLG